MENRFSTNIYSPNQRKNMIIGLIFLSVAFLIFMVLPVMNALLAAPIFYILFKPFYSYLRYKKHIRASFSSAIILVVSFLIIVVPLSGLIWMILSKLIEFQKHPEALTAIVDKLTDMAGGTFDKKEVFKSGLNDISKFAIGLLSFFVNGAARIFIGLLILYFTLFFMFNSSEEFEAVLIKYLPFKREQSIRFGKELKNVTYSNIFGQGIIAVCQGIIVSTGFLIFGIPDPLFWGVVSLFVCFLPVVGAPIIIVPAAVIEFASGHTTAGLGILIWGMVLVTVLDNILRPIIARRIADIHPLTTIIGVVVGVPLFGLVGIVMGPLVITYVLLLIRTYEANYSGQSTGANISPEESSEI